MTNLRALLHHWARKATVLAERDRARAAVRTCGDDERKEGWACDWTRQFESAPLELVALAPNGEPKARRCAAGSSTLLLRGDRPGVPQVVRSDGAHPVVRRNGDAG